jgi:hypothetical protein
MNIKQKIKLLVLPALVVSTLGSSVVMTTSASALSKSRFVSILCDRQQGPAPGGKTVADVCREDARDGTLSKKWYDKVIRFEDWKNKKAAALYEHIGQTPPNNNGGNPENPEEEIDPCATETSIITVDCSNGGNPIWGLLLMAINILTAGIGIVAVGGFIYGAILWTTAEDKNAQIVKAKEVIFNVVLGLVAYALLYAFIQFLIPGGVF